MKSKAKRLDEILGQLEGCGCCSADREDVLPLIISLFKECVPEVSYESDDSGCMRYHGGCSDDCGCIEVRNNTIKETLKNIEEMGK